MFFGKNEFGIEREIYINKPYIVKHSKNIIDLIEVGDYVNGHLVVDIIGDEDRTEIGIESDHIIYHYVDDEKIKSIVTKEQFAQAEYKIKEDK